MLREACLCEQPSHRLQQGFGVRLQRLPADLRPACLVLPLYSSDRPLGRPRAAALGRDGVSGDLFFPNDEPEADNEWNLETTTKTVKQVAGIWPTHFNAENAKPLRPSLLLQDETQHLSLLYVKRTIVDISESSDLKKNM